MDNNDLQVYEDEIQTLEEEIQILTEEWENRQHGSMAYSEGEIMKTIKSSKRKYQEVLEQCEFSPDLKTQLDLLEHDLSFMMKLTGIWFTQYSRKPVAKDQTKNIHKYRLSGNCQSVMFHLEFQLVEENQSTKNVSAVVTDLSIIIESEELSDLKKLVCSDGFSPSLIDVFSVFKKVLEQSVPLGFFPPSKRLGRACATAQEKVEESGDLLLFFRSLSRFSEWCEHRKHTWTYFKTKYPEIVVLPEGSSGDYMILRSTQLPGFELMVVWKINVDKEGKVTPVLDLLNKIPKSVKEADKFASEAPFYFRNLLHVLGIQASIETLIQSL